MLPSGEVFPSLNIPFAIMWRCSSQWYSAMMSPQRMWLSAGGTIADMIADSNPSGFSGPDSPVGAAAATAAAAAAAAGAWPPSPPPLEAPAEEPAVHERSTTSCSAVPIGAAFTSSAIARAGP